MADWICLKPECKGHPFCTEVPDAPTPRITKDLGYKNPEGQQVLVHCFCHTCEQTRRQAPSPRNRWKVEAKASEPINWASRSEVRRFHYTAPDRLCAKCMRSFKEHPEGGCPHV